MLDEKVLNEFQTLEWLSNHFGFDDKLFKEERVIQTLLDKCVNIPNKNCLECDEYIATQLALQICDALEYRKKLKIEPEIRYLIFQEKTNMSYDKAYEKYFNKLKFFYKKNFGISTEETEDLASETIIQSFEKIELYHKNLGGFDKWLYSIGQNIYLGKTKKYKLKVTGDIIKTKSISIETVVNEDSSTLLKDKVVYDNNGIKNEEKFEKKVEILYEIINKLPEKYKNVLLLYLKYEYKYLEIQEAMSDISINMIEFVLYYHLQAYSIHEIYNKYLINPFFNLFCIEEDCHQLKAINTDKIEMIINFYENYKFEIFDKIIKNLYCGKYYRNNNKKIDILTEYIDYLLDNGIEIIDYENFDNISNEVKYDLINNHLIKNYYKMLDFMVDKIYEEMSYNLSTIKTQIKLGKEKVKKIYNKYYSQYDNQIENEFYDAFDLNNFSVCSGMSSSMMN